MSLFFYLHTRVQGMVCDAKHTELTTENYVSVCCFLQVFDKVQLK